MKQFFSTVSIVIVFLGAIFSTPSIDFIQNLINGQIQQIKTENTMLNIAFAQEEGGNGESNTSAVQICCSNGETANEGEVCNNAVCTPMLCCSQQQTPNIGYICDNTLSTCGAEDPDDQTGKEGVCVDPNALNAVDPYNPKTQFPNNSKCMYGICCNINSPDYDINKCEPVVAFGFIAKNGAPFCSLPGPVCCNEGYDDYVANPNLQINDCVNEPTPVDGRTVCNCESDPHTGSFCGGNACLVTANFSVVKTGVDIGGDVTMLVPGTCDFASEEDENDFKNYLAGLAAADATPATPLNSPVTLNALTVYKVTSKDYCLNIDEVQGLFDGYNRSEAGLCCDQPNIPDDENNQCVNGPSCGSATSVSHETEPISELCSNGTASSVSTNSSSYDWTCSVTVGENTTDASCTAVRTCNGGSCSECTDLDCGQNDQCKNVVGTQDGSYLSSNNVAPDSYGVCWNASTGACGSIIQVPYVTETPTTNLCISGSNSSPVSYDSDSDIYSWNCQSDTNGNSVSPICQVRQCQGSECQTEQATNLIVNFKAKPSIVSKLSEGCLLTWDSEVDSSIPDPEQGCKLNGVPVSDDNVSGTRVAPGAYSLMCTMGVSYQIKSAKCSLSPEYKEI